MRLIRIARAPWALYRSLSILFRDLRGAGSLVPMNEEWHGGILYRGLRRREIGEVERLYVALSSAKKLAWYRKVVYWLVGDRMVVVAIEEESKRKKIVGFNMFYFNARDVEEGTIHSGFIGVIPEKHNQGIGANLRRHGIWNFRRGMVNGLSSRIDLDNGPSLKITLKAGFEIVEKYRDKTTGRERYYLLRRFEGGRGGER